MKKSISGNQLRLHKLLRSQIPLNNDVFMVFANSKRFCQEFLRVILQDKKLIVIDNEIIGKWDAGLKVYYVNTKGLTNKNINDYLKLLTDKTTISKKYKQTSSIKKEIYEIGGATMGKEMREILDSERAEGRVEGIQQGRLKAFAEMVKDKILTVKDAAKRLGISEMEFNNLAKI